MNQHEQLVQAALFPICLKLYAYGLWWFLDVFWRYVLRKYQSSLGALPR